ncbi:MAG: NAD-dependent protein deacylase [Candidatus Helarchaeales archaeon]
MSEVDKETREKIEKIADLLLQSKNAVVLSGAGISTESGIPDFRGPQGLWTQLDGREMDLASIDGFERAARGEGSTDLLTLLQPLIEKLMTARPNAAHKAVGKLYRLGLIKAVITQNIDNLHQRGGARNVIEVHGTYKTATCMGCKAKYSFEELLSMVMEKGIFPPSCKKCGNIIKPDVVFFGEQLPPIAVAKAMEYSKTCDLMLVLGSSLVVYPIAIAPNLAKQAGAKIVIINEEPTDKDHLADIIINDKLGKIMPLILEAVQRKMKSKS